MKKSVNDIALSFISSAQENLEYLKNPLSMFDTQRMTAGAKINKISSSLVDSQRMLVELMHSTQKSLMEQKDVTMAELTTQQLLGIINHQEAQPDPIDEEDESDGRGDNEESEEDLDELSQASRTVKEVQQMIDADSKSYKEVFDNIQLQLKQYLKKLQKKMAILQWTKKIDKEKEENPLASQIQQEIEKIKEQ